MTTHYIDITLQPDAEFSPHHLMGALFSKLHKALVLLQSDDICASYPQWQSKPASRRTMGTVMRVHGSQKALTLLMAQSWLNGMRDHIKISEIAKAVSTGDYLIVRRRQFKTNVNRLRRRHMKRHGLNEQEAIKAVPDFVGEQPDLPFMSLASGSTRQKFCIFVDQIVVKAPAEGIFNAYGMSPTATVPSF